MGFLSQTLISGFWATTFSEDVLTFSLGIAFFFLGMGLASLYVSRINNEKRGLILFSLGASVFLGVSIPFVKFVITLGATNILFPVFMVFIAGFFTGFAVPLTLRATEGKSELGFLFLLDYLAAILFSFLFTFVLLVPYGYQKTAFFVSLLSFFIISFIGIFSRLISKRIALFFIVLEGLCVVVHTIRPPIDPKVIYQKQTHYQKIVLTEFPNPIFANEKTHHLYLDGFLQFSGEDEQVYHACLVNIPMSALSYSGQSLKNVLVLGGGDGLVVRNLLQNLNVEKIDLVELDPEMIRLAKEHPILYKYNNRSLHHNKVNTIVEDAFTWIGKESNKYDLIIIDFPAPKNLTLARLFSLEFYSKVKKRLNENGFISIQAGPSYSFSDPLGNTLSEVTTSIEKTLIEVGFKTSPYVTSKESEAFILAWNNPDFKMDAFALKMGMDKETALGTFCTYSKAWKRPKDVRVNTLNTLPLSRYMLDWFNEGQGGFFVYSGSHAVFLPE